MKLRYLSLCACFGSSALFSIVAPTPAVAQLATAAADLQAPGYYRMALGDFQVTALLDGTVSLSLDKLLMNVRPGALDESLTRSFETLPVETSINAFLINTGAHLILVDTGAGELFGASGGLLLENLKLAGYSPEQIDMVLLTHVHADHSGGLVVGGRRKFPNAVVYVNKADVDYWFEAAAEARAPVHQKHAFGQGQASLKPYMDNGQLKTFTGSVQIVAGVRTVPAGGHTPGHTFYQVESKGQTLVLWGDIVHASQVQFPDPHVTIKFDVDASAAEMQRKKVFEDAVSKRYWVGAAHIAFPGIGHVRREDAGYAWVPANYSRRVVDK